MDEAKGTVESIGAARQPRFGAFAGLLVGLVCGLVVWGLVQAVHPVFSVPEKYHIAGIGAPPERHRVFRAQQDIVDRRHMLLYLSAAGLLLGAGLGVAWRRLPAAVLAAGKGMFGGALGAFLASLFHVATRDEVAQDDLLYPFLRQLIIGVFAGAWVGQGIMLRRGWRSIGRGLLAGAIGGVAFAVVFTLITAMCLPEANTQALLPEEPLTRLLWFVSLTGTIGLAVAWAVANEPNAAADRPRRVVGVSELSVKSENA